MLIEKYTANPAAGEFIYVTHTLGHDMRLIDVFAFGDILTIHGDLSVFVYKGTIAAWAIANNQYAVYCLRQLNFTAVGEARTTIHEISNLCLPAGVYTFAAYCGVDMANVKLVFSLVRDN